MWCWWCVVTQCNVIAYAYYSPIIIDIELETSEESIRNWGRMQYWHWQTYTLPGSVDLLTSRCVAWARGQTQVFLIKKSESFRTYEKICWQHFKDFLWKFFIIKIYVCSGWKIADCSTVSVFINYYNLMSFRDFENMVEVWRFCKLFRVT